MSAAHILIRHRDDASFAPRAFVDPAARAALLDAVAVASGGGLTEM